MAIYDFRLIGPRNPGTWWKVFRAPAPKELPALPPTEEIDPILEILMSYPISSWSFRFSESRIQSAWAIRATATCVNAKGAQIQVDLFAPPAEAVYEAGFIKVMVDTICVFRRDWDGYLLHPERSVRAEVLRSHYWKWLEPRYMANLRLRENDRLNDMEADNIRSNSKYQEAISRL